MKLPAHLRRETILLKPETNVSGLHKIGEEITEVLDYIPAELYLKQYICHKYAALQVGGPGTCRAMKHTCILTPPRTSMNCCRKTGNKYKPTWVSQWDTPPQRFRHVVHHLIVSLDRS